jgi:hypothetical protein
VPNLFYRSNFTGANIPACQQQGAQQDKQPDGGGLALRPNPVVDGRPQDEDAQGPREPSRMDWTMVARYGPDGWFPYTAEDTYLGVGQSPAARRAAPPPHDRPAGAR